MTLKMIIGFSTYFSKKSTHKYKKLLSNKGEVSFIIYKKYMANYLDLGGLAEYDNLLKNYIDNLSMTNGEINNLCDEYLN